MAATSGEFATHEFDIWAYLCLLPSYLQRKTVPRTEKTTTHRQKDNISIIIKYLKYGHFYYKIWQNEMRDVLTGRNLWQTSWFYLQMVIVAAHYFTLIPSSAVFHEFYIYINKFIYRVFLIGCFSKIMIKIRTIDY